MLLRRMAARLPFKFGTFARYLIIGTVENTNTNIFCFQFLKFLPNCFSNILKGDLSGWAMPSTSR